MTASVRYPLLAPDVEIPWPADLERREAAWGHEDDPPLRLEMLEAGGTFSPPRPKRTGLIRGLLFVVPVLAVLIWAIFVVLP